MPNFKDQVCGGDQFEALAAASQRGAPDYVNAPRPYDLDDPREVRRLIREVNGYLRTCIGEHHGTDRAGRAYAADAIRALMERDPQFTFTR